MNPGGTSWIATAACPTQEPAPRKTITLSFLESTTPWALATFGLATAATLTRLSHGTDLLEREAMQPSGVPVADEFYGPTGAFRGTETCDVAGYL